MVERKGENVGGTSKELLKGILAVLERMETHLQAQQLQIDSLGKNGLIETSKTRFKKKQEILLVHESARKGSEAGQVGHIKSRTQPPFVGE
jgi:hypothetical protein